MTFTAAFHYLAAFEVNSWVAALRVENEWWNYTVTLSAYQAHSRDEVAGSDEEIELELGHEFRFGGGR